jgi:hypothetical protein
MEWEESPAVINYRQEMRRVVGTAKRLNKGQRVKSRRGQSEMRAYAQIGDRMARRNRSVSSLQYV